MPQAYLKVPKFYRYALLALFGAVVTTWVGVFSLQPDYNLHVDFFDVGQGDAIFIRSMSGTQVLIDGGPDAGILRRLGSVMPFYDRTIDLIVLTHPHADHVLGLVDVLKRYRVKAVLTAEVVYPSAAYAEFLRLLDDQHVKKYIASAGQKIYLDEFTIMQTLYPVHSLSGEKISDLNGASIVQRLSFGQERFLFMGDATKDVEEMLLTGDVEMSADVLKVGHHGSRGSTGAGFLSKVNPEFAVISAGQKNRYGHPHEETLQALAAAGVIYFSIGQDGTVRMTSDGVSVKKL